MFSCISNFFVVVKKHENWGQWDVSTGQSTAAKSEDLSWIPRPHLCSGFHTRATVCAHTNVRMNRNKINRHKICFYKRTEHLLKYLGKIQGIGGEAGGRLGKGCIHRRTETKHSWRKARMTGVGRKEMPDLGRGWRWSWKQTQRTVTSVDWMLAFPKKKIGGMSVPTRYCLAVGSLLPKYSYSWIGWVSPEERGLRGKPLTSASRWQVWREPSCPWIRKQALAKYQTCQSFDSGLPRLLNYKR